ncbi:hypothetical protein CK203_029509 [Vitis vinifera]|uniref:Uncharacterized protein n=1 Tax=Vitis vinifera TaxID=29760 RepID=A0A438JC89_VITVI|nr:hypothetical protein CK203_029509 [Vitis vinifera]
MCKPKEVVYDLLACEPSPPHAGGYETIDEKSVREHDIHCELKSYCLANVEVCFLAKWAALTWIDFEGLLIKMTPVCPFVKAARPDDATSRKPNECPHKHQLELEGKGKKDSGDSASTKKILLMLPAFHQSVPLDMILKLLSWVLSAV